MKAWLVVLGMVAAVCPPLLGSAYAQGCSDVPIPLPAFSFPRTQRFMAADGSVMYIDGKANALPADSAFEVFRFNPLTGVSTAITQNTPVGTRLDGEPDTVPNKISGTSADGRYVFIAGDGKVFFTDLTPPGLPRGQYPEASGLPRNAERIDTVNGSRQRLGVLSDLPLQPGEIYVAAVDGNSDDGRLVFMSEAILAPTFFTADNRLRNIVSARQARFGLFDVQTGAYLFDDFNALLDSAAPGAAASALSIQSVSYLMSGDANAFAFQSTRRLEAPGQPRWIDVPNNVANIGTAPYVYYLDRNVVVPIAQLRPDVPRPPVSRFNFVRNAGRTGTVFGLDRGASFVDAPINPSGANTVLAVRVGQAPEFLIGVPQTVPPRGTFSDGLVRISRDERTLYFQSARDLVAGQNSLLSLELFAIDLPTRRIRQISALRDGISQALANDPVALSQVGDRRQVSVADASDDGQVVAYTVGGFTSPTIVRRDANGRVVVSSGRFGGPDFPYGQGIRIARCSVL